MAEHCPFLDRGDARCAEHFRVDRLGHTFDHCFADYRSCPTYRVVRRELAERRHRAVEIGVELTLRGQAMAANKIDRPSHARIRRPIPQPRPTLRSLAPAA